MLLTFTSWLDWGLHGVCAVNRANGFDSPAHSSEQNYRPRHNLFVNRIPGKLLLSFLSTHNQIPLTVSYEGEANDTAVTA